VRVSPRTTHTAVKFSDTLRYKVVLHHDRTRDGLVLQIDVPGTWQIPQTGFFLEDEDLDVHDIGLESHSLFFLRRGQVGCREGQDRAFPCPDTVQMMTQVALGLSEANPGLCVCRIQFGRLEERVRVPAEP